MKVNEKLAALRQVMAEKGISAVVVSSRDPHLSEYTPSHWKYRFWLSGFTGSAGTVVVTQQEAGLWTDFRYYIQADQELAGTEIATFRDGNPDVPTWQNWLADNLANDSKVSIWGAQLPVSVRNELNDKFKAKNISLDLTQDIIGELWTNDREPLPSSMMREQVIEYAGKSRAEKISDLRKQMTEKGADWYLASSLDDVAWIYNVRGDDIAYCPFILGYAIIGKETSYFFTHTNRVPSELKNKFDAEKIIVLDYAEINNLLLTLSGTIYFTPEKTNALVMQIIEESQLIGKEGRSIITATKAIKNDVEIANFYRHYREDGVAMVKFLYSLENAMNNGEYYDELLVDKNLSACRAARPESCGDSFSTIAGYGPHAAMCHYSANEESNSKLEPRGLLLIDSGGQYFGATTDITRTLALGELTAQEKMDYTLTLKGHINIAMAKFLTGCNGANLDVLARVAMWSHCIDFKHGTGHGIGCNLSVHEGPQGISLRSMEALTPGMMTTIEPGIYREGKHGIRLENVVLCRQVEENEFGTWLEFDAVTLCPFDTKPLIADLLTIEEKEWLNNYHKRVYDELSPLLDADEITWLAKQTHAI